jgi:hypothetical protein
MEDETDFVDFETGPFCRHWSDPSDCDRQCKCGHECCHHFMSSCNECDCSEYEDIDEK